MAATTIHNLFEFDGEFKTRLDFSKPNSSKVAQLLHLEAAGSVSKPGGTRGIPFDSPCSVLKALPGTSSGRDKHDRSAVL